MSIGCLTLIIVIFGWTSLSGQSARNYNPQVNEITQNNSELLLEILNKYPEKFAFMLANPNRYKVQIIFTQINRYKNNLPVLKHHTYNLDTLDYFYPASLVKLPTVLMALEKLNKLDIPGLDKYTPMKVMKGYSCQSATSNAELSRYCRCANIAHYIKDVFLVSGNLSYDRLYEFVGQQYLNEQLWKKGYRNVQITQRYGARCTRQENRYTNPIVFHRGDTIIYSQPMAYNPIELRRGIKSTRIGEGQEQADGTIVFEPRDFTYSNSVSLKDLHDMLIATMMPMAVEPSRRFQLTKDDYRLVHEYMSMVPTESTDPVYDRSYFNPCRMKYLLYGNECSTPKRDLRIFNKVGLAAGFLTDCAYIVDFQAHVEFFVSVTIYTNSDGIVGNNNYQYWNLGMPFLKNLGEVLYEFESNRKRKILPNLEFYKHDYRE